MDRGPAEHGAEQQANVTDSRRNQDRPGHAQPSLSVSGRVNEDRALVALTVSVRTHRPREYCRREAEPTAIVKAGELSPTSRIPA